MPLSQSRISRMTEWWRPKAGVIFSLLLFYMALWSVPFQISSELFFYSFITLTGFGLIGYFLNDWADIPYDKQAGKTNLVDGLSPVIRWMILLGLIVMTLIPWVVFFEVDRLTIALLSLQLVLLVAYPIPPIRLKNKPRLAMAADSLYAFVIPSVLAWHTMDITANEHGNTGQIIHFGVLGIWMFALGLRQILNHHVVDAENDRKTDTPNIALEVTPFKLRRVVQAVIFPIELTFSILFFAVIMQHSGFLPLIFVVLVTIAGASHLQAGYPFFNVPFAKTRLDVFNTAYLGLVSCFVLVASDLKYLVFLGLYLVLFTKISSHPIVPIAIRKILIWMRKFLKAPWNVASLAGNWSIYYFRKWVLNWPEERNWGEHYQKHLSDVQLAARKEYGVVAVFNQNYNKYTETFVSGRIRTLPFHVVQFHGWPSPIHVGNMESLIAENGFSQEAKYSLANLQHQNVTEMEDDLIVSRLLEEKAQLILAEFGTMGARLVNVSVKAGLPLVVTFYGYDAWHSGVLKDNEANYKALFERAKTVIGVSEDLCKQLVKLGCPEDKVSYLPCFVDLERFQYVERDFTEARFLTVGRFCQTKAPELTILAFKETLGSVPQATLVMVGADDGQGILESCKALVRALGIIDKVTFKGPLTPQEVHDEMKKSSIFVQHSVTSPETGDKEGTPVAIMEAMATGLPVVSTKHAGIQEIVEDGVSGLLVDEYDYLRMAEEMIKLSNSPEVLSKMSKSANQRITSNPLIVEHSERLSQIIQRHIA